MFQISRYAEWHYAKCSQSVCCYADHQPDKYSSGTALVLSFVILSDILLHADMMSVIIESCYAERHYAKSIYTSV